MFLTEAANRGSISTVYDIDNSLKLESDNTERVNKAAGTISGAGNRRTFTISFWTKRTEINGVKQYLFEAGNSDADNDRFTLRFGTGDTFDIQSSSTWLVTNRVFRDTSAWYHFVIKVDTTDGTAGNRIKLYVNGVEETSFSTDNRSSINQNHDFPVNNTEDHIIGNSQVEGSKYYNGYIAEWIQLDGTAAAPTSFGEFDSDSGIWKPKNPSGLSFGTNGFWLDFEDSSNLGNDASGGTDFTLTNVAAADQAVDTPTNNFATWNALFHASGANDGYPGGLLISEGATEAAGISGWDTALSTIAVSSGKWYAEFYITGSGTPVYTMIGAAQAERFDLVIKSGGYYVGHSGSSGYSVSLYGQNGTTYPAQDDGNNDSVFNAGAIIGVALDMDNHKIYWRENGTWLLSDDPASNNGYALGWTGDTYFGVSQYDSDNSLQANFGGYHANTVSSGNADADGYGNFEYSVPSGYYALCTKNLAEYG